MYDSATELHANRNATDVFIRTHPYRKMIQFSRESWVTDNAGGWTSGTTATGVSTEVALIAATTQLPVRRSQDGQEITPEYIIVARHDADIKHGDWFFLEGIKYEVVFVYPDKSFQVKAEVVYRG